jgi:hypothetical protein
MALYHMTFVHCGHVLYDLYHFWYLCSMTSVLYSFTHMTFVLCGHVLYDLYTKAICTQ